MARPGRLQIELRPAARQDAAAVAALHADSWRRHYRGAYADAFLDGDVDADRLAAWSARLAAAAGTCTIVAAHGAAIVGFAHAIFDEDPVWGALLDNLHVAASHQRRGIGSRLLAGTAATLAGHAAAPGLYLWVLDQNVAAQAFYEAHGAGRIERAPVPSPGGVPGRLAGSPMKLRYAWPDARVLT